jgi:hypothetical protein
MLWPPNGTVDVCAASNSRRIGVGDVPLCRHRLESLARGCRTHRAGALAFDWPEPAGYGCDERQLSGTATLHHEFCI